MSRHLEDWELDMILGGDGTPEMEAALANNITNQKRLAQLQHEEQFLLASLFRVTCPTPLELGEWHLKLLGHKESEAIRSHLDHCSHCEADVTGMVKTMSHLLAESAPKGAFKQNSGQSALKRIIMKLESILGDFGSSRASSPIMLRGASSTVCYA